MASYYIIQFFVLGYENSMLPCIMLCCAMLTLDQFSLYGMFKRELSLTLFCYVVLYCVLLY